MLGFLWQSFRQTYVNKLSVELSSNLLNLEISSFVPWMREVRRISLKDVVTVSQWPMYDMPAIAQNNTFLLVSTKSTPQLYMFKGEGFRNRKLFNNIIEGTVN